MRTIATIEARMNSTRLPGKVLLPAAGEPLLHHLVARLCQAHALDGIILATTTNSVDDALQDFASGIGLDCYRGSELDVMHRVIQAATTAGADVIVEITADCPLLDPVIVDETVGVFATGGFDYVSNVPHRPGLRTYPDGMNVQVMRLDTLRRSARMTQDPLDREHVTHHIRRSGMFRTHYLDAPPELTWPELGLTLDEPGDYELLRRIIEHFDPDPFGLADVLELLRDRPEWVALNDQVERVAV